MTASASDIQFFRNIANPDMLDFSRPEPPRQGETREEEDNISLASSYRSRGERDDPPGRDWQTESQFRRGGQSFRNTIGEERAPDPFEPFEPFAKTDHNTVHEINHGDEDGSKDEEPELCWDEPERTKPTVVMDEAAMERHKEMLLAELNRHPSVPRLYTIDDDLGDIQMALNQVRHTRDIADSATWMKGGVLVGCAGVEELSCRYGRGFVNLDGYTQYMMSQLEKPKFSELFIEIYRKYFQHGKGMNPIVSLLIAIVVSAVTFSLGLRDSQPNALPQVSSAQPVNRVKKKVLRPPNMDDTPTPAPSAPFVQGMVGKAAGPLLQSVMSNPDTIQNLMGMFSGVM